tara:strand:+ start:28303 stop:35469 length:7167 start_codon:yes stop_codon:yes gene_type:complete
MQNEWEDIKEVTNKKDPLKLVESGAQWEDIETSPADIHIDRNFTSETGFDDDVSLRRGDVSKSLQAFRGTTPDVAANVSRIAKENKVPYDFISNNKPAWEGFDEAKKVHDSLFEQDDAGTYKFPKTVAWLSNPEAMAKSKDDIKTLTDIEYAIKKERRDDEGFLYKSYRGAVSGLNSLNQNISDIPAALYSVGAIPQNFIADQFDIEDLKTKPPEWLVKNFAHEYFKKQGEEHAPLEINDSAYKHIEEGNYSDAAMTVYLQALNSAPTMAAMFAGNFAGLSSTATLTGVGALEAAGANTEGLERGKSSNDAIAAGMLKGVAEGFFEKYTLGMFKGFGKQAINTIGKDSAKTLFKDVAKNIAKNTGVEGSSEMATSFAQDFADYITGEDDALEGSVERSINAFLVGGFMGTSTTIVSEGIKHYRKSADLRKKQQTFNEIEEYTKRSKLAERDPDGFKDFIDNAQGENKHIYMDAEKIVEKFQSLKQSNDNKYKSPEEALKIFAKEIGVEDQIDEALKNGTELEIKTSDWLIATKNNEIGEELKGDIRYSIDGISENEEDSQRTGTIKLIEKLQKEHDEQLQIEEDLKPALEQFRNEALNKENPKLSKFKADEVDFLLQLWKQKALTTAKNQGTSPLVELKRIIPKLNREGFDGQSGLYQKDSEGKNLFVAHNLSEENLTHAFKMGGLAVPSVAVTKKGQTLEGFGDITLIANPELLKSPKAKVFDGDIYSPRYPSVERVVNTEKMDRKLESISEKGKALLKKHGVTRNDVEVSVEEDRGSHSFAMNLLFTIESGKSFKDREKIGKYVRDNQEAYGEYVENFERRLIIKERIFDGFTPSGKRKYLNHNLDTVVKIMRRNLQDGEGFNYGVGSIRSKTTTKLGSLKKIAAQRDRIVSKEQFELIKEDIEQEYSDLFDSVLADPSAAKFFKSYRFGVNDIFTEHLKQIVDEGIGSLETYYKLDNKNKQAIVDFLDKLKNMETQYFEGKIQRAVDISEFSKALVPAGTSKSTIKSLQDSGLEVVEYKEGERQSQIDSVVSKDPNILFQKEGNDPKGAYTRELNLISLFEKADFSTLVHESVHSWMADMEAIINSGEGTKDIARDFDVLKNFANSEAKKSKKIGFKDGKLTDEGHEILARAGEAYFREGKAPTVALMEAFRNFENWLKRIYKSLSGLDVELTDEVRGVFDRMFATEAEIDEATMAYDKKNSLMDLVKPTKREREAFDKKKKRAKEASASKLLKQKLKAFLRTPGVKEEIEKEAKENVEDRSEYKTIDFIVSEGGFDKSDLINDFGEATFEKIKQLDKGLIAKKKKKKTWQKVALSFGGVNPKSLSKGEIKMLRENGAFGVLRKDGMHLDVLAEAMLEEKLFSVEDGTHSRDYLLDLLQSKKEVGEIKLELGRSENISIPEIAYEMEYESPEQLLNDILSAKPKSEAIKNEINSIKENKENDILMDMSDNDGLTAEEAIHNDITITSLIAEAQIIKDRISKTQNKPKSKIGLSVIREAAKDIVENREIKRAGRYDLYAKTEQKYATQAYNLFKDGKLEEALKAKELQILNHALVQEAVKARDYKIKIERKYKTSAVLSRSKNTDFDFVNKAFELIEQFSLSEGIEPLDDSKLLELEDLSVDIAAITPDWIIHENQKTWKDLTVIELRELDDTIQDLMAYGNNVIKSLKEDEILTMDQFRESVLDSMGNLDDKRVRDRFDKLKGPIDFAAGLLSKTKMVEFVFERLDFYSYENDGVFGTFRKLFNTGVRVETAFIAKKAKIIEQAGPSWEVLNDAKKRLETEKGGIAFDIEGVPVSEEMTRKGRFQWTPEELIAITLNLGNAGNIQAMENSYGFSPKQFDLITSQFSDLELQAISNIWRVTDSLFPELNKTHFKINNRYLDKVQHEEVSFLTNSGKRINFEGGYYPLVFDHQLSFKAQGLKNNQDAINEAAARDRRINVTRATKTKSSMTKQRVKNHSLPPKLSLDVWFTHISDTVRYSTHSEYLRDLNRVTMDEQIRKKIEDVAGTSVYTEIRDWAAFQALPEKQSLNNWERMLDKQRQKATAVILGANISVGVKQRLSMFSAMRRVGAGNLFQAQKELGFKSILGVSTNEAIEATFAQSDYLQARSGNIDKEISDSRKKLSPLTKTYKVVGTDVEFTWQEVQDFMFEWIQMNDRATVATVWRAGFNKFYNENGRKLKHKDLVEAATEAADELVRTTQPSTLPIDLNGFQRGGVMMRLITPFMTWSFKYGNIVSSQYRKWQDGAMTNQEYFKHTMMDTVIPAMGNVLVGSIIVRGELPEWWELVMGVPETMISSIPLAREVTSLKYNREIGDLTAFEGARRYVKAGKSLNDSVFNDRAWNDTLWNIGRLLEYQSGVSPLKFIHDVKRSYNNFVIDHHGREPARRR